MRAGRDGALSLPLATALALLALLAFGTWGTLRKWQGAARLQLALDLEVGREALALRDAMARIEGANERIRRARLALSALLLAGPTATPEAAALRSTVRLEAARQDAERAVWALRRVAWTARGAYLPEMGWRRAPENPLGPLPLERTPGDLSVEKRRSPRAARARVFFAEAWHAHWD